MSEPNKLDHDPHSLRNTIKMALGDKWTRELEDQLFWPLSSFCNAACEMVRADVRKQVKRVLFGDD